MPYASVSTMRPLTTPAASTRSSILPIRKRASRTVSTGSSARSSTRRRVSATGSGSNKQHEQPRRGQPTSVPQDRAVVLGKDFLRREAGEMDHAPEAIASSGKMMSYGGRSHSGIDPAEDHRKPSGDDIWERIGHGVPHKFSKSRGRSSGAPLAHPRVSIALP